MVVFDTHHCQQLLLPSRNESARILSLRTWRHSRLTASGHARRAGEQRGAHTSWKLTTARSISVNELTGRNNSSSRPVGPCECVAATRPARRGCSRNKLMAKDSHTSVTAKTRTGDWRSLLYAVVSGGQPWGRLPNILHGVPSHSHN